MENVRREGRVVTCRNGSRFQERVVDLSSRYGGRGVTAFGPTPCGAPTPDRGGAVLRIGSHEKRSRPPLYCHIPIDQENATESLQLALHFQFFVRSPSKTRGPW
jgi:hypothetical protein